jgi:FtsH-binding integral membrane protein
VRVNTMAGWCLIIFGVINVLHEISLTSSGRGKPGLAYAVTTAILFTAGAVLLWRGKIRRALAKSRESKIV